MRKGTIKAYRDALKEVDTTSDVKLARKIRVKGIENVCIK